VRPKLIDLVRWDPFLPKIWCLLVRHLKRLRNFLWSRLRWLIKRRQSIWSCWLLTQFVLAISSPNSLFNFHHQGQFLSPFWGFQSWLLKFKAAIFKHFLSYPLHWHLPSLKNQLFIFPLIPSLKQFLCSFTIVRFLKNICWYVSEQFMDPWSVLKFKVIPHRRGRKIWESIFFLFISIVIAIFVFNLKVYYYFRTKFYNAHSQYCPTYSFHE
jgi:hypothetical protein